MTEWIRLWLLSVVATALLTALADCLISQGAIRQIARLAGGLLMVIVLLRPLVRLPMEELTLSFDDYRQQIDTLTRQYQAEQKTTYSAIIEQELAAYIVDKAAELGLETVARVTAVPDEAGLPLPEAVHLTIPKEPELADWLEEELGIPAEAQYWQEE